MSADEKSIVTTITFPAPMYRALVARAASEDTPMAVIVRRAVSRDLGVPGKIRRGRERGKTVIAR